jgi:alkanesulfonate monooxygenase SsuD/methylene tetrahydromethanopterin reductase-like flavin-dependent oxidoreductase (luciferase family)
MSTKLKFGVLLPHFGEHASADWCIEGAQKAEDLGFDSVWVRDHLVFQPHDIEGSDNRHIEGLLILSAVAAVTQSVTLGTAMTICHRHPIHLAQAFAGLSAIANGRVVMGMGLGGFPHEFAAAGLPTSLQDRANLARINVDLCRRLWTGEKISYKSDYYNFDEVAIKPTPVNPIPIWGGGGTPAACRRVLEYCDGWMPARITLATFEQRIDYLRQLCQRSGRPMIPATVMPLTSIARDKAKALHRVDVQSLIDDARNFSTWVKPASGSFSTLDDIRGALLAGSAADIVQESRAYEAAGADHIVYDLRLRYGDWYEQVDFLGNEVLPALRA